MSDDKKKSEIQTGVAKTSGVIHDQHSDAKRAFSELVSGGDFEKLTQGGKMAFRAYAQLPSDADYDRREGAKRAALDAARDVGIKLQESLSESDPGASNVAESKDPTVKNQNPTGAQR